MEPIAQRARLVKDKLKRQATAELLSALQDAKTIEVMLNPDGTLWAERLGEPMRQIGSIPSHTSQSILETVAGFHRREVLEKTPILECEWPLDGSRFAGQLPPVVQRPTFAIRKKAVSVFTLSAYVESGIMSPAQKEAICEAVKNKKNILVVGGTSSGKTTLVNAIIREIVDQDIEVRLVTIEDTKELQIFAKNYVSYFTTSDISMTPLLKTTLRMRPDRICVGETRGPEALDLLMAWNTGHPGGAATIHANSAAGGLSKMVEYISMHPNAPRFIEPMVGEVVDIAIYISRTEESRRVREILNVNGYCSKENKFNFTKIA